MSDVVELYDVECVADTDDAICCEIEGEQRWIPKSQVHDDSEVYEDGTSGTLIIKGWWARKEGLD